MGIFGIGSRRNRGNDVDFDQVASEQAAFLDQIDQFRLQQEFLEEQRQRLIEQQEFDFQGLLSQLDALKEQQQQGFEGQLAQSEAFLNDLTARNQQLTGVLEGQAQTQADVAGAQQQNIRSSQEFLSQLLNDVQRQAGTAAGTSRQRSEQQAGQAIEGEEFRRQRQQQLANLAAGAEQRLSRDRRNFLSQAVQDERKGRLRRQTTRANLRGQAGPTTDRPEARRPQTDVTVRLAQIRRDRGQQIQQRRQRAGEPGFLSGTQRSLSSEELEQIRRELRQGRTGFVGPISGRRNNVPIRELGLEAGPPRRANTFIGPTTNRRRSNPELLTLLRGEPGLVGPVSNRRNTRNPDLLQALRGTPNVAGPLSLTRTTNPELLQLLDGSPNFIGPLSNRRSNASNRRVL